MQENLHLHLSKGQKLTFAYVAMNGRLSLPQGLLKIQAVRTVQGDVFWPVSTILLRFTRRLPPNGMIH